MWRIKEAFVGHHIGGELIGASMSEVEPGNKLWPYHTHYANEEWVIVLAGEPTLRTREGEQRVRRASGTLRRTHRRPGQCAGMSLGGSRPGWRAAEG